ncbi:Hypothetical protein (plasmid) [Pseudomonas putida]|nr:Hypothetical protein [Pseudomonas putida]
MPRPSVSIKTLSLCVRVFFVVRQAWRVARKRNLLGYGGRAGDLEVKVLYTPGKGKC